MSNNDSDTFVLVKDSNGERFLCPINAYRNPSSSRIDAMDDCIEEDVIGRYAGKINIKPS